MNRREFCKSLVVAAMAGPGIVVSMPETPHRHCLAPAGQKEVTQPQMVIWEGGAYGSLVDSKSVHEKLMHSEVVVPDRVSLVRAVENRLAATACERLRCKKDQLHILSTKSEWRDFNNLFVMKRCFTVQNIVL
jgi:hypothetical protein